MGAMGRRIVSLARGESAMLHCSSMSSAAVIGKRLELALELADLGAEMYAAKLRRENPSLSATEVEALLVKWFQTRPGAELGDAAGRCIAWPRRNA